MLNQGPLAVTAAFPEARTAPNSPRLSNSMLDFGPKRTYNLVLDFATKALMFVVDLDVRSQSSKIESSRTCLTVEGRSDSPQPNEGLEASSKVLVPTLAGRENPKQIAVEPASPRSQNLYSRSQKV